MCTRMFEKAVKNAQMLKEDILSTWEIKQFF